MLLLPSSPQKDRRDMLMPSAGWWERYGGLHPQLLALRSCECAGDVCVCVCVYVCVWLCVSVCVCVCVYVFLCVCVSRQVLTAGLFNLQEAVSDSLRSRWITSIDGLPTVASIADSCCPCCACNCLQAQDHNGSSPLFAKKQWCDSVIPLPCCHFCLQMLGLHGEVG